MRRTPLKLRADDLSDYARALARQIGSGAPSHLKLMNMLARAAGFQNVQHMRAVQAAERRALTPRPVDEVADVDHRVVARVLAQFDAEGRLMQWPARRSVQTLALWVIWVGLPAGQALPERALNALLGELHSFDDPATLRRTMIANGMLRRSADCSDYTRVEQRPPAELTVLLERLKPRRAA